MDDMKKIEQLRRKQERKCYIGIRESDIYYASDYFTDNICLFSSHPETEPFSVRLNQNIGRKEMFLSYLEHAEMIQEKDPDSKFVFYNQATAYNYPEIIRSHAICLNPHELIAFFNNKITMKKWFAEQGIPVIPYETFLGSDICLKTLTSHFPNCEAFVIQRCHGGGGIGTFRADVKHFAEITACLEPSLQYIVSPYLNSVSANTHVFVAENQTVLSPGSIQIVELRENQLCYRGGDFIAFRNLSAEVRERIKNLSFLIANLLRNKNYRGIAGIDFIIDEQENVYCAEINPRFQASTLLLDKYLKNHHSSGCKLEATSTFELNEMAFKGEMITTLSYNDCIDYSCYYYYSDGIPINYYVEKCSLLRRLGIEVFTDGMQKYIDEARINKDSYLFRAIFPHAICNVSPDITLWINDNIQVFPQTKEPLAMKIALLNQGVRLDDEHLKIKQGTYESIDILVHANQIFDRDIDINCAYKINLSHYSPYTIKTCGSNTVLRYYDQYCANITIEKDFFETSLETDKKILYIATDRLRIKQISGCENKNVGEGCCFCNLPVSGRIFSIDEIFGALTRLQVRAPSFKHILIGGGTNRTTDTWKRIVKICKFLKASDFFKAKPISLMSEIPPILVLPLLKEAGVEEVVFNMEIVNENLARKYMPAKRAIGKDSYYDTFREAVKIFGIGHVRSTLLVGFDRKQELYNEIISLANIGVVPSLSALRILPKTIFEGTIGPDNRYLLDIYNGANKCLGDLPGEINELGPACVRCRNNMLIL